MMSGSSVIVVTVSEQLPGHGNKTDIAVFSTLDKAETWIEHEISLIVKRENLSPDAVDGWFVEFPDASHTIQFDVYERDVL